MKKLTGKGKDNIKVGNHPLTNMISKLASMRRGEDKCRTLKMHLKLRDQQPEIILHTYRWLYQTIMGTTNKITIMATHIKKKMQDKHNTKDVQQITREDNKKRKGRKKTQNSNQKKIKKMTISIFLPLIALNVNGLNASTKRHSLAE